MCCLPTIWLPHLFRRAQPVIKPTQHCVYLSIEGDHLVDVMNQFRHYHPRMETYCLRIYTQTLDDAKHIANEIQLACPQVTIHFFDMYQFTTSEDAIQFNANMLKNEGTFSDD